MKRIVFATFGSLGDVHPYLAIALELERRGHRPLIATSDIQREAVERAGIAYARMRPGIDDMGEAVEVVKKLFRPVRGPEYLMRELLMPHVRSAYEDLNRACADADMIVAHPLAFAARLVAEKRGLPWHSTVLSPLSFMSAIDPPLLGAAPWLLTLRKLGVMPYRAVFGLLKRMAGRWEKPLHALRAELGLPPLSGYAQFEGQFAPEGTLALFSRVLAEPQADWPPNSVVCGFSRYDADATDPEVAAALERWLDSGPPPIVFTLGSSVSMYSSGFFAMAVESARRLRRRALLVTGQEPARHEKMIADSGAPRGAITAFRYLPYSRIFPRAAANVHQAGVGTLAQALAAGRPQLACPVAFDQPDNARRAARLGIGLAISFQTLTADAMTDALREILAKPSYAANAEATARLVLAEEDTQRAAALLSA